MKTNSTHDYLIRLRDLILQERHCAVNLDMDGMMTAMNAKAEIIQVLSHVQVIDEEDKPLAADIRNQNRRNAFLFKSTLGWLRGTMEFFGHKTVTSTYGASANTLASHVQGRLLSGRV
jgi:hypothetical protein